MTVFDNISSNFHGILHVFVNFVGFRRLPEFHSSAIICAKYQKPCLTMQIQLVYTFNNTTTINTTVALSKCESKAVTII